MVEVSKHSWETCEMEAGATVRENVIRSTQPPLTIHSTLPLELPGPLAMLFLILCSHSSGTNSMGPPSCQ